VLFLLLPPSSPFERGGSAGPSLTTSIRVHQSTHCLLHVALVQDDPERSEKVTRGAVLSFIFIKSASVEEKKEGKEN
jgi:hypothetical protein